MGFWLRALGSTESEASDRYCSTFARCRPVPAGSAECAALSTTDTLAQVLDDRVPPHGLLLHRQVVAHRI